MYKFLTAVLISITSLVVFAHEHGKHENTESEKKVEQNAEKKTEKKATEPTIIKYEDPKKYYPKK